MKFCRASAAVTARLSRCSINGILWASGQRFAFGGRRCCISALKNEGIPALLQAIEDNLPVKPVDVTALLPFAKTGIAAQLRKAGALVSEEYVPEGLLIHARVEPREMALIKPYIVENNSESENV